MCFAVRPFAAGLWWNGIPTAKDFSTFISYSGPGVTLEKNDQRMLLIGMAVVILSLALAGLLGKPAGPGGGAPPVQPSLELTTGRQSFTGTGTEDSDTQFTATINETNIVNVTVTLTWNDEADTTGITGRHQNQPDELGVTAACPDGDSQTDSAMNTRAPSGGEGSVTLMFTFNVTEKTASQKTSKEAMGNWDILVHVGNCGDQTPNFGPGVVRTIADGGNSFTLTVSYTYYARAQQGAK
jgi:hypothetical protein